MAVGLELTSERANSHADKLQWQRQGMGQAETAVASRTALLKSPWQCTCKVLCQAYTQCRVACMRAAAAATATTEAAATEAAIARAWIQLNAMAAAEVHGVCQSQSCLWNRAHPCP